MVSDRARDVLSFVVLAGFTLMLAGTSKAKQDTPLPLVIDAGGPVAGPPPDVDLTKIAALMNCKAPTPHKGCRLYADFAAGTDYVGSPTNELWYGDSYAVGGPGDQMRDDYFMNIDSTPTGIIGAGRTLVADSPKAKKEAEDLITALRNGRTIPGSPAASFMRTSVPSGGWKHLDKTSGKSSVFIEPPQNSIYVRKNGKRLMVVEYTGSAFSHSTATSNGALAMAWIAEMWLVPP
jgi:hypothetical protein